MAPNASGRPEKLAPRMIVCLKPTRAGRIREKVAHAENFFETHREAKRAMQGNLFSEVYLSASVATPIHVKGWVNQANPYQRHGKRWHLYLPRIEIPRGSRCAPARTRRPSRAVPPDTQSADTQSPDRRDRLPDASAQRAQLVGTFWAVQPVGLLTGAIDRPIPEPPKST